MYTWRVLGPLNAERIWSHSPILILWFLKLHLSEIDKKYIYISIILRDMSTIMLLVSLGCLWNSQTSKSKKTNRMVNPPATQRLELLCLATLSPNHSVIVQRNHSHGYRFFQILWDILRSFQILSDPFSVFQVIQEPMASMAAGWCYGTKTTLWPPRMHWAPQPEDSLKSYQSE